MSQPHSGQIAIVTGASKPNGIGAAAARRLARDGASLVICDLGGDERIAGLAALARAIELDGGAPVVSMAVDVASRAEIGACVAAALERFGRIDVLVNNAGSTVGAGPFLSASPEDWESSFRVNLLGPTLFCQAALPAMRAQGGGAIVNVSSTGGLGAEAGFGAYTAMKHGVIGLTKTIAAEFGVDGVRCNAVCPGYVATDMHVGANERIAEERGLDIAEIERQRYAGVALRRAASPDEVARTIAFLAGPDASYITGAALPVSGGTPVGL